VKKSDLEFIVFGLALIALLILATWLATRSLTGVTFAQTPVGNIPPPSGYAWSLTLDDEMNGTSINTGLWNGDYGGGSAYWCGGCAEDYSGSSESGGYIQQVQAPDNSGETALNTAGIFSQHYGYFEAQGQWPNDNGGIGDGADPTFFGFLTGMGKDAGTGFTSGLTDYEIDIEEAGGETSGNNNVSSGTPGFGISKLMGYYATVHTTGNNQQYCQVQNGVRLDQGLHTYGLWWFPDPTSNRTQFQFYLDGNPCVQVGGPQNGQAVPTYIGLSKYNTEGIYLLLQNDACANGLQFNGGISCDSTSQPATNPMLWNYVRVWQAVPFRFLSKTKKLKRRAPVPAEPPSSPSSSHVRPPAASSINMVSVLKGTATHHLYGNVRWHRKAK
jgi:hypothetical protein